MMPWSVLIALGSNRGNRRLFLQRALHELRIVMRVVRVSSIHETEPVDAPAGSRHFLNIVAAGYTKLSPEELLESLLAIESRLGRRRSGVQNEPRTVDLDLIFHSANLRRSRRLTLPHPRYRHREFVMGPLRELRLAWNDPVTGNAVSSPLPAKDHLPSGSPSA